MNFIVVGTNHKYSPIEIRERLSFPKRKISGAVADLTGSGWINAAVIISTCNRVELYANAEDTDMGIRTLKGFLSNYHHQDAVKIEPYLYMQAGRDAITHLFKVSGGLDSQILGESPILGQVRAGFGEAKEAGYTDTFLEDIFSRAIKLGEEIREATAISGGDISIGSVVKDLIKERIGGLEDKKILIIGVGKISESTARYLNNEKASTVFVSNRTFEKAEELAREVGGIAVRFDRLKEKLREADIIISATTSPHFILRKEDILETTRRPLLIIDLAVPRDVDPKIKSINGVELLCLDDLSYMIEKKLDRRKREIPEALRLIEKEVDDIWSSIAFSGSVPAEVLSL
jgi:glutamyl-tRNA reductase